MIKLHKAIEVTHELITTLIITISNFLNLIGSQQALSVLYASFTFTVLGQLHLIGFPFLWISRTVQLSLKVTFIFLPKS